MNNQNNDMIYREESRNSPQREEDTKKRTVAELHEAMIKAKEQDFEEDTNDPNEFELDAYNL